MSRRLLTFLTIHLLLNLLTVMFKDTAYSQDINLEYAGSASWNGINDVVVEGDYAYCAMWSGLKIFDIQDPTKPKPVSQVYLDLGGFSIDKIGNLILVGLRDSGMQIIDVAIPNSPKRLGWYQSHCTAFTVKGYLNFALVGCGTKIEAVDISNPDEPKSVGEYVFPFNHIPRDIKIMGDTAFVAASDLFVLDLTDVSNIELITIFSTPYDASSLDFFGNFLCVADQSPSVPPLKSSILLFDIASVDTLTVKAEYEFSGNIFDISIDANNAYIAAGLSGIAILDISGPGIYSVGCYRTSGFCDKLAKFKDYLFVVHENNDLRAFDDYGVNLCDSTATSQIDTSFRDIPSSFFVLDISDKLQPKKVSFQNFFRHPINSAIGNKYVYVANGGEIGNNNEGLTIFEFCSVDSLTELSSLKLPGMCEFVFLKDEFVYACNWGNGLYIVDVSAPRLPKLVGQLNTPGLALSVFVKDNYAFIADGGNGLVVGDITSPDNPQLVGHLFTDDFALDVKVQNNVAYVADRFGGLQIIDVTNPANPELISKYPQVNDPVLYSSVQVLGNRVFAAGGGIIKVIEVSDPANPIELGSYQASSAIYDIEVSDSFLYVALGREGISVLDVSEPDSIRHILQMQTPGLVFDLEAKINYIYISDYYSLVRARVLTGIDTGGLLDDVDLPNDFELFQNYPNPFNGSTTINYRLLRTSFMNLKVYNTLGQCVATLIDDKQLPGSYSACWSGNSDDGKSVSSGIYFYQLRSLNSTLSRKMVFLK